MAKLNTQSEQTVTQGDLGQGGTARKLLYSTVERFERLQEERDALGSDQKEIMEEAKAQGLDTAIVRRLIQRRRKDPADLAEADAVLELYEETLKQAEREVTAQSLEDGE